MNKKLQTIANISARKPLRGHIVLFFLFSVLACYPFSIGAQLSVQPDEETHIYTKGRTANFEITSPHTSGQAQYTIQEDERSPILASGTVQVNAGSITKIPFTRATAGMAVCTVNLLGQIAKASIVFSPYEIDALENEPADLDAFWARQVSQSNALPLDAQVSFYRSNGVTNTWRVNLANINNRRVYGYISIPTQGTNFPAILTIPPYGEGANLVVPEELMANVGKVIAVSMSIHNADPASVDPNAYEPNDISNKERFYYKQAIIGAIRMIDYIQTRPEFDGQNLGIVGVSQGGGLGTIVAGLDDRVNLLVQSNPALTRHQGKKYEQASGFPYYLWQSEVKFGTPAHYSATANAAKYYDAIYFASRYKHPVMTIVGYEDNITPAAGTFALHNQFRDKTILLHAHKVGHNHPAEYWNGRYDIFKRYFATTRNGSQSIGYAADAGEDREVGVNGTVYLKGKIEKDFNVLNNVTSKWEQVSGPGVANFATPNRAETSVTFSAEGTYVLRYSADDYNKLAGENKFYTIADHVVVTVGEGGGTDNDGSTDVEDEEEPEDNEDEEEPDDSNNDDLEEDRIASTLSFLAFDQNDNFDVQVTFSAPAVGLGLVDFAVEQGQIIGLSGWGEFYFLKIQPFGDRVEIQLLEDAVRVLGGTQTNAASNRLIVDIIEDNNSEDTCNNITDGGQILGSQTACMAFEPTAMTNAADPSGGDGALEYRWQQSFTSESGPWQDIPNSNSADFTPSTITQNTWFRRLSRRANCGDFEGVSNVLVKAILSPEDNETTASSVYCGAQGEQPWWQWIAKFKVGDFVNYSDKSGYGDYTNQQIELVLGETYPVSLMPQFAWQAYDEYWRIWIDYNQDGDFEDANELVFFGNGEQELSGQINIPTSALSGVTKLRVAMKNGAFADPCEQFTYGEVEDYTVMIKNNAPSNYCEVRGEQPWIQWINQVQFGNINNYSGKDQYGNYTNKSTIVSTGSIYPITLRPGFSGSSFDMYWQVWIDYNQDGDFTDPGERVLSSHGHEPIQSDIFIPNYAAPGVTRMRVAMRTGTQPTACNSFTYGEVEDYSIQIKECSNNAGSRVAAILDLRVWRDNRMAKISLITNTEYKNDYFILEHSADGENFDAMEMIPSKSELYLAPNAYELEDHHPQVGENYYRVKQVYKDGMFRYSPIHKLIFSLDVDEFTVFPNPVQNELFINLPKYAEKTATLQLYNQLGQLVQKLEVSNIPRYPIRMELENNQLGVYYLNIQVEGQRPITEKILINSAF